MRRRVALVPLLAALVTLTAVAAVIGGTRSSSASFTTTSQSSLTATAAKASGWMHLHSQATDPDGDTGYATQVGNSSSAARGEDEGIVVDFVIAGGGTYIHPKVLKVKTSPSFPVAGVTAITVTVTALPDPSTGLQPISKYGLDPWDVAPTYTKTITGWPPDSIPTVKRQLNLQTKFPGKKFAAGLYEPSIVMTVTYTGFTTAYYQYTIPIRIQYQ